MSLNRENVIFQMPDGRWARGFYAYTVTGEDYEWDVEYDDTRFEWLRTGFATERAADEAWDGANPGSYSIVDLQSPQARLDAVWATAANTPDHARRG